MKVAHNVKQFPQNPPSLELLMRRNRRFKETFIKNRLFKLMESGYFRLEGKREKFLDYFQVWSNYFQKIMLLKTALCDDPRFSSLFYQHFVEEFGHDQMLIRDRINVHLKKDAVLEAICNWFFSKMLSLSPYEQIVVINLCLEAAAVFFYGLAKPTIDPSNQLEHFQVHDVIDLSHEEMGVSLLENLSPAQYSRLFELQEDSWAMIEALIHRLAELVQKNEPS
jgi:hypothetical protein